MMNGIDNRISEGLSSCREADFIWVPQFSSIHLIGHRPSGIDSARMLLAVHCDGLFVYVKGKRSNATALAEQMKRLTPNNDSPLLMIACYAAQGGGNSVAQQFATTLECHVIANTGKTRVETDTNKSLVTGITGDGIFLKFHPKI
jgi:hypothetical protein